MILNFEETFIKNNKIGDKINLDNHSNNEELFYNKINALKKQKEDINNLVVEKLRSGVLENSKIMSPISQRINNESSRLNNLITDKKNTSHVKVLSMPKLTINNNVINNITVINNGKTLTNQNKSLFNDIGNNANFTKKVDFTKNLNILNQKYTRNEKSLNILASINTQNNFITKPFMNTLDLAKEILNNKNKFVITNFNSKATQLFNNKEPVYIKNQNSITSRKVPNTIHVQNEKNFQTIDVNNQVMHIFIVEIYK